MPASTCILVFAHYISWTELCGLSYSRQQINSEQVSLFVSLIILSYFFWWHIDSFCFRCCDIYMCRMKCSCSLVLLSLFEPSLTALSGEAEIFAHVSSPLPLFSLLVPLDFLSHCFLHLCHFAWFTVAIFFSSCHNVIPCLCSTAALLQGINYGELSLSLTQVNTHTHTHTPTQYSWHHLHSHTG